MPRIYVPLLKGEYSNEMTRKSFNYQPDSFLVSGGSIEKYLKNTQTPKGTKSPSIHDDPLPTQSPLLSATKPALHSSPVPPMSNLIIAMALQNNFTASSGSAAQSAEPLGPPSTNVRILPQAAGGYLAQLTPSSRTLQTIAKQEEEEGGAILNAEQVAAYRSSHMVGKPSVGASANVPVGVVPS